MSGYQVGSNLSWIKFELKVQNFVWMRNPSIRPI